MSLPLLFVFILDKTGKRARGTLFNNPPKNPAMRVSARTRVRAKIFRRLHTRYEANVYCDGKRFDRLAGYHLAFVMRSRRAMIRCGREHPSPPFTKLNYKLGASGNAAVLPREQQFHGSSMHGVRAEMQIVPRTAGCCALSWNMFECGSRKDVPRTRDT